MVKEYRIGLKELSHYSEREREDVFAISPICRTYWEQLERNPRPDTLPLATRLRLSKAKDFLKASFATALKSASTQEICSFWSNQTDERVRLALNSCHDNCQIASAPRWAVFAYGKLGSQELNLSSDIDLLLISAEGDQEKVQQELRQFRALIADATEDGFCHRMDLNLRAGGRMGPVIASFEQWQDYFANYGEAWERLTFIRLRPIWGDSEIQNQVMSQATKMTYRKYLDFSMVEELKNLRQKIHEQNWMRSTQETIDLKLGAGGIRDLELFIHTLQVIYGGRSHSVRTSSTSRALDELVLINAISPVDMSFIRDHYWQLRHFENLVQAIGDQQTHLLNIETMASLVPKVESDHLRAQMTRAQNLVSTLLGPLDSQRRSLPESEQDQKKWLLSMGIDERFIDSSWSTLFADEVLSRQRERDEQARKFFVYQLLTRAKFLEINVETILPRLGELLKKIRAKASLFHMMVNQPQILDRLCHLLSTSGYLSQILIFRPELLDSFVLERQPETSKLMTWEDRISIWRERRMLAELVGGLDFLKDQDLLQLTRKLSTTADSIVTEMLKALEVEFHSDVDLLCLGKWGGRELGLGSDLDFILVTQGQPTGEDFKVARRLLTRLTSGDPIYGVDLRLKPYGGSGVLMTSMSDLHEFLRHSAPTWQRLCYLKTRSLFGKSHDSSIVEICLQRGLSADDLGELAKIRMDLIQQNSGKDIIKYGAGGLLDLELFSQTLMIQQELAPVGPSQMEFFAGLIQISSFESEVGKLKINYLELRKISQFKRLRANSEEICKDLELESVDALERCTQDLLTANVEIMQRLDPRLAKV